MKRWMPLLLLLAVACARPTTAYDWGRHDDALYALMRDPGKLEPYGKALREVIDRHPDGRGIPPGICAEYGYVLLTAGKGPEAEKYFQLEKTLWPESRPIVDRMIENCHAKPKAPDGPGQPAAPAPAPRQS
jgi:hypothetical protein